MHLLIHIYYNNSLFNATLKFIKLLKLSPYRWLELLLDTDATDGIKELFEKFDQDTRQELWIKRDELVHNIQNPGVIDAYISGELGYNLLFVHQASAMNKFIPELNKFANLR